MNKLISPKKKRELKEEDLQLEPLCNEVMDFTVPNFVPAFNFELWMCSAIAVGKILFMKKYVVHFSISYLISYIQIHDYFTWNKGSFSRGLTLLLLTDGVEVFDFLNNGIFLFFLFLKMANLFSTSICKTHKYSR